MPAAARRVAALEPRRAVPDGDNLAGRTAAADRGKAWCLKADPRVDETQIIGRVGDRAEGWSGQRG